MRTLILSTMVACSLAAADWKPLNGKNLDGWEVIGDGQWTVMADGTLLGQRIGDYRKMLAPGGPSSPIVKAPISGSGRTRRASNG